MHNPHLSHLEAAHKVLCYLEGTVSKGILLLASSSLALVGFSNLDWVGCPITWRSTIGYLTMLGSSPISWKTKK
ncbi:Cysteine-rich RLK (RECEPTOR-like protein kinase) 8 [Cucumis melo var. makuwa]|uniref:Cysteine-rich RLK (RECEPTOR-like protein kinase) 8 n=1 Tax=Cucumis melo var. makuwa TaxID=1194695 RepID=A0A5D3D661_CUCMM|nr:Cysteine-rich RLK (RECEPTOR-like protein kinase) 8 [Cucumis melo var. makuwa]TYK19031.1 Cysteine-rich RLK (RECEPTOR-like protein kinase) 8 [Cucumis melo var. makuwa]